MCEKGTYHSTSINNSKIFYSFFEKCSFDYLQFLIFSYSVILLTVDANKKFYVRDKQKIYLTCELGNCTNTEYLLSQKHCLNSISVAKTA